MAKLIVLHVLRRGRDYPALNDENDNITIVLGINFWESDLVRAKKFVTELPVEFPILLWPEPEPIKGLGLFSTLPTGILTAPDGEVKSAFARMVDVAALKSYIDWQKPKTK